MPKKKKLSAKILIPCLRDNARQFRDVCEKLPRRAVSYLDTFRRDSLRDGDRIKVYAHGNPCIIGPEKESKDEDRTASEFAIALDEMVLPVDKTQSFTLDLLFCNSGSMVYYHDHQEFFAFDLTHKLIDFGYRSFSVVGYTGFIKTKSVDKETIYPRYNDLTGGQKSDECRMVLTVDGAEIMNTYAKYNLATEDDIKKTDFFMEPDSDVRPDSSATAILDALSAGKETALSDVPRIRGG